MPNTNFTIHSKLLTVGLLLCSINLFGNHNLDSLLRVLDNEINNYQNYTHAKEKRLEKLKDGLAKTNIGMEEQYQLNQLLAKEYNAFICDSGINYLNKNIALAQKMADEYKLNESRINLSYLLASAGMYKEADDLINQIKVNALSDELKVKYFSATERIYGEMSHYTQDKVASNRYWRISESAKDSLHKLLPQNSDYYTLLQEIKYRDNKEFDKALEMNDKLLNKARPGTPEYALSNYYRSLIYQEQSNIELEKYYLTLSTLADIQSATKDHASLWMLAQLLFNEGDIERAYKYMRFSWNETKFYNARLRSWQSADVLSLVDKTYQAMIEKQNKRLEQYALLTTILLILLGGALLFIYRSMKKLSVARNHLETANGQLSKLNQELKEMNECLQTTNLKLSESNHIKEEYIARFVKLCSTYIDKLNNYRRMVHKKINVGQVAELQKMTRSQEALDPEFEELYANFDTAFLHIFPDFVTKFNDMLMEGEEIVLKRGELLNTELRIFALIRLGIKDSSQIAEFLRYSVHTIYNYRSKVKNKAKVSRENFEELIMNIR